MGKLPSKYDMTKQALHGVFQRLREGRRSIEYEEYRSMRKKIVDTLMDRYNLEESDRDTLKEYFDRCFAELSGFNIVVPRRLRKDGNPALTEGFDIGITTPDKFPHENTLEIEIIAGLATSPYRKEFSEEMIGQVLKPLGSEIIYPEEPAENILQLFIPALREASIRNFAITAGEKISSFAKEMEKARKRGEEKEAFELLKTIRRYLGYCRKYGIEVSFSEPSP